MKFGEEKNCNLCNQEFSKPYGISTSQWRSRKFCSKRCAGMKIRMSDDEIYKLYLDKKSCSEINGVCGLSSQQVSRVVNKFNAIRSPSERQKLSHSRPEVKEKLSKSLKGIKCKDHVKDILRERVGSKNHNWRAGLTVTGGYIVFTSSKANGENAGRLLHTVIAEWKIKRKLNKGEVVHHIDENKLNNQPNNLEIMSHSAHNKLHALKSKLGRKKCQDA